MPIVEVRRHTMRVKPGQHLSQAGVTLARKIGETIGPFNRVITSTIPRAYETAIAMGFAVDEQLGELAHWAEGVEDVISWDAGFVAFAENARQGGVVENYIRQQGELISSIARSLPDDGAALVISHGGIVESQVVGCLPTEDFTTWDSPCDYCEGARLFFDGERFLRGEVLRADAFKS